MAATDFGALSAARKRVWSAELWQAGRDANFWMSNGFVGANTADMGRPVHKVTELTPTERGDQAIMQLVADLQEDGVAGDSKLEGQEEALFNDALTINLDMLRHAVRSKGKMSEQRTVIRFRQVAKAKLGFWMGDKIDELMFLTASGVSYSSKTNGATRGASQLQNLSFASDVSAPTSGRIFYGGSATATSNLTAADKMTWNLIVRVRAWAERKKIKPIRAGGKGYYAMVMSTEQHRDLETDNTYQTLVSKAHNRGANNPLFNNALAVVGGVILYSHQKVFNTLGAASGSKYGSGGTVDGAQALFMGAQALGLALIGNVDMAESDNTDYGNRPATSVGRMFGLRKPVFKSLEDSNTTQDFGLISVYTAAGATQ